MMFTPFDGDLATCTPDELSAGCPVLVPPNAQLDDPNPAIPSGRTSGWPSGKRLNQNAGIENPSTSRFGYPGEFESSVSLTSQPKSPKSMSPSHSVTRSRPGLGILNE